MENKKFNLKAGYCPYCGSQDLDYDDHDLCGDYMIYNATCNECNKDFSEDYIVTFVGKTIKNESGDSISLDK